MFAIFIISPSERVNPSRLLPFGAAQEHWRSVPSPQGAGAGSRCCRRRRQHTSVGCGRVEGVDAGRSREDGGGHHSFGRWRQQPGTTFVCGALIVVATDTHAPAASIHWVIWEVGITCWAFIDAIEIIIRRLWTWFGRCYVHLHLTSPLQVCWSMVAASDSSGIIPNCLFEKEGDLWE